MPGDIRSFFGAKPVAEAKPTTTGRRKRVVNDSDEDEAPKAKRPAPAKKVVKSEGDDTNTSDYFASSKQKPAKAAAPTTNGIASTRASPAKVPQSPAKPNTATPQKATRNGTRTSSRISTPSAPIEVPSDVDMSDPAPTKSSTRANGKKAKHGLPESAENSDFDLDVVPPKKATPAASAKKRQKATAAATSDSDDTAASTKKKTAPKRRPAATKKSPPAETGTVARSIIESVPLIRPPSPQPVDDEEGDEGDKKNKFKFGGPHPNSGPPPAAGSKDLPTGEENCLAGLSFVFTGLLESLERDAGTSLIKEYGGRVVGQPSKKTDFIVMGDGAGPSKLKKIKELGLKVINEDGLFELIRKLPANGGDSRSAAQHAEKLKKEEDKVKALAKEMEQQEKAENKALREKQAREASRGVVSSTTPANPAAPSVDSRLWTVKYAPQELSQICGNKTQVDKLQRWLHDFARNQSKDFKMAGKDGSGTYRAVMIHGPPGIGKTTAAHLVAKAEGYDVVESNASDTRSKKLVENGLKGVLDTTSLLGYFAGDGQKLQASKRQMVLIMDEVDGMSAGDRGGVGALAAVCKKSNLPMILICNDRKQPKMKPFDYCTYDLPFRKPSTEQIRSRVSTILFREQMKLPPNVVQSIIEGTGADLRQVVNMVSTVKLDSEANSELMNFDQGKQMAKAWEKHVVLKPWDIASKILGGGMFASTSSATINNKAELYFNDHEFSYLMVQENYLGTDPILSSHIPNPKQRRLKQLSLASKAADSISDGDLIDRMIHGSQQQWSLMPAHAIMSFVRPASFVSGSMAGHQTRFTSWLGKNSAQGKAMRLVKEVQGHMRLRTTGDRHEIRQQYLPVLWVELVKKLQEQGKDGVDAMIELMDSYYLTKDDFDSLMELGVGPMDSERVKIDSAAKSAFTREYNKRKHPIPFIKASTVLAPKSKSKERPDLEEAIEESEDEVVEVKEEEEEDNDLSKDKYIKQPKKKGAKGAAKGTGAEEDGEPASGQGQGQKKKGAAKGKAAAKGKGKG